MNTTKGFIKSGRTFVLFATFSGKVMGFHAMWNFSMVGAKPSFISTSSVMHWFHPHLPWGITEAVTKSTHVHITWYLTEAVSTYRIFQLSSLSKRQDSINSGIFNCKFRFQHPKKKRIGHILIPQQFFNQVLLIFERQWGWKVEGIRSWNMNSYLHASHPQH